MMPLQIQYELRKRDIKQKEIARDMGVSEFFISAVIRKKAVSDRVMKGIARRVGRSHMEVFAEYYFGKNRRKKAA